MYYTQYETFCSVVPAIEFHAYTDFSPHNFMAKIIFEKMALEFVNEADKWT